VWKPISEIDLTALVDRELAECSEGARSFFEEHRIAFAPTPIRRLGSIEHVFVIWRDDRLVIYYEDVEEGFAVDTLTEDGMIPTQSCDQFQLTKVLSQLMTGAFPTSRRGQAK